jgi:hypothetical protein
MRAHARSTDAVETIQVEANNRHGGYARFDYACRSRHTLPSQMLFRLLVEVFVCLVPLIIVMFEAFIDLGGVVFDAFVDFLGIVLDTFVEFTIVVTNALVQFILSLRGRRHGTDQQQSGSD